MASTTFSGPVTSTNGFVGALTGDVTGNVTGNVTGAVLASAPVNVTTATVTITQATHGGRVITLNRAAGITATLPAASGTGAVYRFVVGTTFTGNGIIKVANANDVMAGNAIVFQDAGDTMVGFEAGATDDTITLNGTTTGGLKGADVEVIDVAANLFFVHVRTAATGTEATPFSATV